jgi:hypothetical protein
VANACDWVGLLHLRPPNLPSANINTVLVAIESDKMHFVSTFCAWLMALSAMAAADSSKEPFRCIMYLTG